MKIENFREKRVLILGFGKEGKDTLTFFQKIFPKKIFGIADENNNVFNKNLEKVKWHLGKKYLKSLKYYDIIIKSPGIPIHLPEIKASFRSGKITSQTEIFFNNFSGKIIGVTGTKGKSTTASLIYKVLKEAKKKVKLGGNIGKPILNYLLTVKKDEIFVLELSSHQLYNLKKSPHIAVFLNFFPEHLDYYKNLKEYLMAKANICRWQEKNDYLIYNFNNKWVRQIVKKCHSQKIPIRKPSDIVKSVGIKNYPFVGHFYNLNIAVAVLVGQIFNLEKKTIKVAIEKFKSLPHRLEFVGKYGGIYFYNDSLSTIPETTISAIEAFQNKIGSIILGGFDRQQNFNDLAKKIIENKISVLILFPPTGNRIWHAIITKTKNKKSLPRPFFVKNMKDAVKIAYSFTKKNKICLLSPASASFGLFKNYKERGNLFKKYIKIYGQTRQKKD